MRSWLISPGCRKDPSLKSAVITGYDIRNCICCGGLMLNFNGETEPYKGNFFLLENQPSELGISESTKFPVYLEVAFTQLDKCNSAYISITDFKLK